MMPAPSRLRRRLRRQRRQSGPMFSHGICVKYLLKASFHSVCWQKGNGNSDGDGTTTWPNQNAARQLAQILFAINLVFFWAKQCGSRAEQSKAAAPPTQQETNRPAPASIINSDISCSLLIRSETSLMILPRHSPHF